jgi:hypothetical protein
MTDPNLNLDPMKRMVDEMERCREPGNTDFIKRMMDELEKFRENARQEREQFEGKYGIRTASTSFTSVTTEEESKDFTGKRLVEGGDVPIIAGQNVMSVDEGDAAEAAPEQLVELQIPEYELPHEHEQVRIQPANACVIKEKCLRLQQTIGTTPKRLEWD